MSHKEIHRIIKRPVFSEKSMTLKENLNKVTFEVDRDANKLEIREAIEALLGAKVKAVNTLIVRGKSKRMGRFSGRRSNWKKAVVTLAEGSSVAAFDLMDQFNEVDADGAGENQ
ncbi:MAG: 50S ribosomal protein L23 [Deltaproteobacteria bacterium]|nr:50S ribosomal protein L23 [Deltaproteobacteria bacterium]